MTAVNVAATSISSVTLEVPDPAAADGFYTAAFGLGAQLGLRASEEPTTGFRGFTLSLVVSRPATVDGLIGAALDAGATPLKAAKKSLWGYGGVVSSPDGTIWKVATSSKKDTGPATRQIDDIVLLLGVADVIASQAVLRRPGSGGEEELRPQVRRVRRPGVARQAGALRAPCPGQGRRRLAGGHRIAPDRHRQRCRALHRPGRVRVGGHVRLRCHSHLLLPPGDASSAASTGAKCFLVRRDAARHESNEGRSTHDQDQFTEGRVEYQEIGRLARRDALPDSHVDQSRPIRKSSRNGSG